jgi:hypothetical protein
MFVGFVDAVGRVYDLTFRSVRRRLFDRDGDLYLAGEEAIVAEGRIAVEMATEQRGSKVPLLAMTDGEGVATTRRVLFLSDTTAARTPETPTRFNIPITVPFTAVQHLLLEAGGREMIELLRGEIESVRSAGPALVVTVRTRKPWNPEEVAPFWLKATPRSMADALFRPVS